MKLIKACQDDPLSSVSDLMSGLMIIFLFISLAYMVDVKKEEETAQQLAKKLEKGQERIKTIAVTYKQTQVSLYEALYSEFQKDLPRWKASISSETLAVRFLEPEILFQQGESKITDKFKKVLNEFFPRYLKILFSDKFKSSIAEIRIEGHTSSEWKNETISTDKSYFNNMRLSQERTRSTLEYCFGLAKDDSSKSFMLKYVTANGLSSSKLIYNSDGAENKEQSRRVEFRVRTNAETKIVQVLEELKND